MQVEALLESFKNLRCLVIGDAMVDIDLRLKFSRASNEFAGNIYEEQERAYYPGGAANVARNCAALGADTTFAGGTLGVSQASRRLIDQIRSTPRLRYDACVCQAPHWDEITTKTRYFLGNRFLYRVDRDIANALSPAQVVDYLTGLRRFGGHYDALLFSDYQRGCFADGESIAAIALQFKALYPSAVIGINPKPALLATLPPCGIDLLCLNEREYLQSLATPYERADHARERWGVPLLLQTKGANGLRLFHRNGSDIVAFVEQVKSPDVVGCGDATFAAAVLARAAGAGLCDIAQIAAAAGTCKAAKPGTQPVSAEEVWERLAPKEITRVV